MGNTSSTEGDKDARSKTRLAKIQAGFPALKSHLASHHHHHHHHSAVAAAAAPRRSSTAQGPSLERLDHSETPLALPQDAVAASSDQCCSPRLSIAPDAADLAFRSSVVFGKEHPRSCRKPAGDNDRRTWSLSAHDSSHQDCRRTNSLTRTFSLSRARSLLHSRRSNSFTVASLQAASHDEAIHQDDHMLQLVAEQAAEDNPYLRTASSQVFEPWRQPVDVPRRPSSTGLPLLPRPNSESDMSLFTPARRRSLRTPGVATRAPSNASGRTSMPSSRRNSFARGPPVPIMEVPSAAEDAEDNSFLTMISAIPRASTPSDLEYTQTGAFKFGTLRITNGSPLPTPDASQNGSARAQGNLQAGYFPAHATSTQANGMLSPGNLGESKITTQQPASLSTVGTLPQAHLDPHIEKLDVRLDAHAKSAPPNEKSLSSSVSIQRNDSGIETTPVSERPEMRLSKADSGYSSKASVRSYYSGNRAGKEMSPARPSLESAIDLQVPQSGADTMMGTSSPEPPTPPEKDSAHPISSGSTTTTSHAELEHREPTDHVDPQATASKSISRFFGSNRRQSEDEGRHQKLQKAPQSTERQKPSDTETVWNHYHWKKPALSSGKGALNSIFGGKRAHPEPIQATPSPPHKSKLLRDHRVSHNIGAVGSNLVQAATSILPRKKPPSLHLKTELNVQLQQDDEIYQDPRFSAASSPLMRADLPSPLKSSVHSDQFTPIHNQQNFAASPMLAQNISPQDVLPSSKPYVAQLANLNLGKSETARHTPPPVSFNRRHGGSFTSSADRRSRQSLPAHVERSISLDRSMDACWQNTQSAFGLQSQAREPYSNNMLSSTAMPDCKRRRSTVSSIGQGQSRAPRWEVETDHDAPRDVVVVHQPIRQELGLPQIHRPSSAGSFQTPSSPNGFTIRRFLTSTGGGRPATAYTAGQAHVASLISTEAPQAVHPTLRASNAPELFGNGEFPQFRGHNRNRSTGSFDRDGNPIQYRVLHSYNSPAYRNVPIWG